MPALRRPLALLAALFSLGCSQRAEAPSTASGARASLAASGAARASGARSDSLPTGPLGTSVRRGRALLLATRDSLPAHVRNKLRCVSCHLDEGRRPTGSWVGVYARYPQYRARSATVETIEDRINDCFQRSMNGRALGADGADMRDIVAYLWFLSRDVPVGPPPPATRLARWGALTADTTRGHAVFEATCVKCHGPLGQGTVAAPPVWGPASFTIGAGMARLRTAATFIRDNMPFDQPGTLTDQQAIDVAAYMNAQRRPDFAAKVYDWPNGDAPPDVAYPTRATSRRPLR
jgi:thiosulfate dehydrogenase